MKKRQWTSEQKLQIVMQGVTLDYIRYIPKNFIF